MLSSMDILVRVQNSATPALFWKTNKVPFLLGLKVFERLLLGDVRFRNKETAISQVDSIYAEKLQRELITRKIR